MATEKKDENLSEYSLATELLTSNINQDDYQDQDHVTIKSQPNFKDLSLIIDNNSKHGNHNFKIHNKQSDDNSLAVTICSNSLMLSNQVQKSLSLCESNPNCFKETSKHTTTLGTFPIYSTSFTKPCLINTSTKQPSRIIIKHDAEHSLQKRTIPKLTYEAETSYLVKKPKQDVNVKLSTSNIGINNRLPLPSQIRVKEQTETINRLQTPGVYEDANGYMFQDPVGYYTPVAQFDTTADDWETSTENSLGEVPTSLSQGIKSDHILFIQQTGTTYALKETIIEVAGKSRLTVFSLDECINMDLRLDLFSLVWMHLLAPLNRQAYEILTLTKQTSLSIYIVTDKLIQDELPIHVQNYVEPLSKETIHKLCFESERRSTPINGQKQKDVLFIPKATSTPESSVSSISGRTSNGSPASPPTWCRVEHATKEKQRRERIKDSCDQLRVLLPYVKGRKTDMASILEMTVDYLKIVNSTLSQDFHSRVIDVMSNGNVVPPQMGADKYGSTGVAFKKMSKKEKDGSVSLCRKTHATDANTKSVKDCSNLDKRMVTRSLSRSMTSVKGEAKSSKAENLNKGKRHSSGSDAITTSAKPGDLTESNPKKSNIGPQEINPRAFEASVMLKDRKMETAMVEDVPTPIPTPTQVFHNLQFPHMFTEGDLSANRMFSSGHVANNNAFAYISHSQMNVQSSHNMTERAEMSNGNICFDSPYWPSFYSNQDSSNGNFLSTEYVNPNAILPVTSYAPRVSTFSSGMKLERALTSNKDALLQGESPDLYNNGS